MPEPTPALGRFNRRALDYYSRLRRVRETMEQDLSRPLPAWAAARLAGLNPTYFSSFFREKVGVRFTEWARHVRIKRAMAILDDEHCSIREVALRVGYTGQRAFERAFKQQTSMTPSGFRRRVRNRTCRVR